MTPSGSSGSRGAFRVVGDDPEIAAMVRQGIRRAQEKLIDLSMRNSMLNYKHSESLPAMCGLSTSRSLFWLMP